MATVLFASNVAAENGLDSTTGYAENYVETGLEMVSDFDADDVDINWDTTTVSTSTELEDALENAEPGDKIVIASGTYTGNFELTTSGTQSLPIWVVAEDSTDMPILDGDDSDNNTVLSIDGTDQDDGISYIYIEDILVTGGRTGISFDMVNYSTVDNVEVYGVGQAGIHLRDGSSYNIVKNSNVHDTGLYNVKYGEAIYIGSDYTKWPDADGTSSYDPAVDYNQILSNILGPNVTAEHIDVKEGSSYSYIIGNTFDAEGMDDIINGGLSFIDFKGNYAEAAYNEGDQNDNEYFENAFEINEKSTGWGYYNEIHDNSITFDVDDDGEESSYSEDSVSVTLTLPLGSAGDVETTEDIDPDHWVVKNNVDDSDATNTVYDNTRDPVDADKMYTGDLTEN